MIAIAPSTVTPAASAAVNKPATPDAAPSFAEKFIGKNLIRQDLPFGYKDWSAHATQILGSPDGYQSVSDALSALTTIADRASYGKDPIYGDVYNAVAVVRNDAATAFALLELDKPLAFHEDGRLVGANHFNTYDSAVVAAVNGVGNVLQNRGPR